MVQKFEPSPEIERLARAICSKMGRDPDDKGGGPAPGSCWLDEGEPYWEAYREHARTAIATMRLSHEVGLSLGKIGAATIFSDYDGDQTCAQVVIDGWNAMIDEILKENC